MKASLWLPVVVFLAVSIPLVLILDMMQIGGEYRLWIALGAGVLATAFTQSRLKAKGDQE